MLLQLICPGGTVSIMHPYRLLLHLHICDTPVTLELVLDPIKPEKKQMPLSGKVIFKTVKKEQPSRRLVLHVNKKFFVCGGLLAYLL